MIPMLDFVAVLFQALLSYYFSFDPQSKLEVDRGSNLHVTEEGREAYRLTHAWKQLAREQLGFPISFAQRFQ